MSPTSKPEHTCKLFSALFKELISSKKVLLDQVRHRLTPSPSGNDTLLSDLIVLKKLSPRACIAHSVGFHLCACRWLNGPRSHRVYGHNQRRDLILFSPCGNVFLTLISCWPALHASWVWRTAACALPVERCWLYRLFPLRGQRENRLTPGGFPFPVKNGQHTISITSRLPRCRV